jgi:hypothetical protein
MTDTQTPREAADALAEGVRTLNYLTGAGSEPAALEYPGDVYDVIANLKIAVQRMPQLFGQLAGWLESEHNAGRVARDDRQDPAESVAGIRAALSIASSAALDLEQALNRAHNASAHLKAA